MDQPSFSVRDATDTRVFVYARSAVNYGASAQTSTAKNAEKRLEHAVMRIKRLALAVGLSAVVMTLAGCDTTPSSQDVSQSLTEKIAQSATNPAAGGVAYPYDEMAAGGWMEEKMLREHLVRQANPHAIRYVIVTTQMGQIMGQWPIQGMVVDPNSQMTTTKMINHCGGCSSSGAVTDAPGDNGTYGPEAGAAFFFTTSGAEIQIPKSAMWFESDVPLNLTSQPLLTYNQNAVPAVNGGGVHMGGK